MTTISVPNLSIGNFASVLRMVEKVGGSARLVTEPRDLENASKIVLAGVGAFDNGMRSLREGGWLDPLNAAVRAGTPVLGICLGMQLMCGESEEGRLPGLGWIDARVKRFAQPPGSSLKVPHMGWNAVTVAKPNPLIEQNGEQRFYFVHSYYAECSEPGDVLATARHGVAFTAAIGRGHIYGVQFHPEKSHRFGMAVIRNFVEL